MDMQLMSWSFEGRYEPFLEHLKLNPFVSIHITQHCAPVCTHIMYVYTKALVSTVKQQFLELAMGTIKT